MAQLEHPIKIVFFDIDWTLYNKDKMAIPASISEQVLPRLKANGIIPAIATGRCFGAFPTALKPLLNEAGFEVFVTINGQYNFHQQQIISQYPLDPAQIERIIGKLTALNIPYAFVTKDEIAVSEITPEVHSATAPIKADYIVDPEHYRQHQVVQMLAFYDESRDQEVANSGILGEDLKAIRWDTHSVDLLKKENSKARGIKDVIAHFGLGIENAMAFGDGFNDMEMLATVGFGVAMGNAEPELKAVAKYVTKPIDEDGILAALQKFGVI